jgi:hypothetical protein
MGLESATYISQLVNTNPTGADDKNQGDNHLRLIKGVLQAQFPNLGAAAMTATAAELNDLIDNNRGVPSGSILMWSGTIAAIPTGWSLCDGTGGTPNLTARFVYGTATNSAIGTTGGSSSHTHTATSSAHTHQVSRSGYGTSGGSLGDVTEGTMVVGSGNAEIGETLESLRQAGNDRATGSATPTVTVASATTLPPYMNLAYIIKD